MALTRLGVQEGEGVLPERQALQAVVFDDLPPLHHGRQRDGGLLGLEADHTFALVGRREPRKDIVRKAPDGPGRIAPDDADGGGMSQSFRL
jgi:hypothetical protein